MNACAIASVFSLFISLILIIYGGVCISIPSGLCFDEQISITVLVVGFVIIMITLTLGGICGKFVCTHRNNYMSINNDDQIPITNVIVQQ